MWLRLKPFKCLWVFVLHLYNFHVCCQWRKEESTTSIGTRVKLSIWTTYAHKHTYVFLLVLYLSMCCHKLMEKMKTKLTTFLIIFIIIFFLLSDSCPQASKQISKDKYIFFLVLSFTFIFDSHFSLLDYCLSIFWLLYSFYY